MPQSEFEDQVFAKLKPHFPTSIDSSLRDSLENRIKYGYEYSLRKRLTLLFREHRAALAKIVPDAERFIGSIVTLRNELTHVPAEGEETRPDGEEWLRYNFLLRVVLDCCFLKMMDFSDDEIARLAEDCEEYRGWAERLFATRNPV